MAPLSVDSSDVAQTPAQQAHQGGLNWIAIYITIPLIVLTGVAAIIGWTLFKRKRAKRNRPSLTPAELDAQDAQAEAIRQSHANWFRDLENYWNYRRDDREHCDRPHPPNLVHGTRQSCLLPSRPGSVPQNNNQPEEHELSAWPSAPPETAVAAASVKREKKRSDSGTSPGITVVKPKQSAINLRTGLPPGITVENVRDPRPDKEYNWRSVQQFRGRDGKVITDLAEISKLKQLMICSWVTQPDPSVESLHAGPSEPPVSHEFGFGGRRPSDEQPLAPLQPLPMTQFSAPVVLGSKPYADSPLAMVDAEANNPYHPGSPYEEYPATGFQPKKRKKEKKRRAKERAAGGFVDQTLTTGSPQYGGENGYIDRIDAHCIDRRMEERDQASRQVNNEIMPSSAPAHHSDLSQPFSRGDGYFSELAPPKPAYCHDPTGAMPSTPVYPTTRRRTGGRQRAHTRVTAITSPDDIPGLVAEAMSSPGSSGENPFSNPVAEQSSTPVEPSSSRPEVIFGSPNCLQPFRSPQKEAAQGKYRLSPRVNNRDAARTPSPTEEEVRNMREQTRQILTGQATPTPVAAKLSKANGNERYP